MRIILPWPPSVNNYWRRKGGQYFITPKGRDYRNIVVRLALEHHVNNLFGLHDRIVMTIDAYPPDGRRRDLDNVEKAILDALEHAGIYPDDAQIDRLTIQRQVPDPPKGMVHVTVVPIEEARP